MQMEPNPDIFGAERPIISVGKVQCIHETQS